MTEQIHQITKEEARWMSEDGRITFSGLERINYSRNDWHNQRYYHWGCVHSGADIPEVISKLSFTYTHKENQRIKYYVVGEKLSDQFHSYDGGRYIVDYHTVPVVLFNETEQKRGAK